MTKEKTEVYYPPHSVQWEMRDLVKAINSFIESDRDLAENANVGNSAKAPSLLTRFEAVDELLGGLAPGELMIVSGADGGVLTDFLLFIAATLALDSKEPVALCAPRFSMADCHLRLVSALGRINRSLFATGELTESDWPKLTAAMNLLQKSKLFVYADEISELRDLTCLLRELEKYSGLCAVFIDAVDSFKSDGLQSLQAHIDSTIASLHSFASAVHVPVVISMGLLRKCGSNGEKQPSLQDINLTEQSIKLLDRIVLLRRNNRRGGKPKDEMIVDVYLAHNAFGSTGVTSLRYLPKWGSWCSLRSKLS